MSEVVKILKEIWDDIPYGVEGQKEVFQEEHIKKYIEMFHFGEFFYIIFNTKKAQVEFVSENVASVLGYEKEEFKLDLFLNNLHKDDLPYYFHYEKSAIRFFSNLPKELFFNYKFAYDFRLKTKNNIYKRVQQQVVPLYYFPDGGVRTLGIFTDLSHFNIHGIPRLSFIGMNGAPSYYNVHLMDELHLSTNSFTKKEREILNLMVQGFTSQTISEKLNRSIYTINNHRKNILKKSGCESFQELLIMSLREGWV